MTSTLPQHAWLHEAARRRLDLTDGGAFLVCDWTWALLIHFSIDPDALQPHVPLPLQTHGGLAYVTLAGCTVRRLRMHRGDNLAPWNHSPLQDQPVLQLRVAVEHEGESGAFLLAQWLPGALQWSLSERRFGLPCHFASLDLRHDPARGDVRGRVLSSPGVGVTRTALRYRRLDARPLDPQPVVPESLDAFLLHRFTVFTEHRRVHRLFRLWHQPWQQQAIDVALEEQSLVAAQAPWFGSAQYAGAHLAPLVRDVTISRPQWMPGPGSCWG